MAISPIFEGFSVTHAAILDGTTGLEEEFGDIYGVRSGSVDADLDSYDNTGDDGILSTWNWLNKANINITSGYVPFKTISLMTGSKITSSGTGSDEIFELPLWEDRQMNTTPRPMRIRIPSKDKAGVPRIMDFIFYKVQFQPISFDGPTYKEGMVFNYSGSGLKSDTDHMGNPVLDSVTGLPTTAVGKMIILPA